MGYRKSKILGNDSNLLCRFCKIGPLHTSWRNRDFLALARHRARAVVRGYEGASAKKPWFLQDENTRMKSGQHWKGFNLVLATNLWLTLWCRGPYGATSKICRSLYFCSYLAWLETKCKLELSNSLNLMHVHGQLDTMHTHAMHIRVGLHPSDVSECRWIPGATSRVTIIVHDPAAGVKKHVLSWRCHSSFVRFGSNSNLWRHAHSV
jgi:hypothetical protein